MCEGGERSLLAISFQFMSNSNISSKIHFLMVLSNIKKANLEMKKGQV